MTDEILRAGIVGYGYMGQIRRRNVEEHPDFELAGICDPRLTGTENKVNAFVFPTYQSLIDTRPGVVFVCTPNHVTPEVVIYALEHGCHVFCEKPPGRNLGDIQRIIAIEQNHPGLKLIFGFNHRHHPGITDAKAIVDSGSLGQLLWMRGVYGKSGGENFESSWRNDPVISGGGILIDQGIHMLDLFLLFGGDFNEVVGTLATNYWDIPVEDNAFVLLCNTDNGVMAQLHSSATLWKHTFRLEIGMEKGYLVVSGLLSKTGSYGRETLIVGRKPARGEKAALGNPREEITYYDIDPSWDIQVQHLVECIREDRPVADSNSADALKVMEIIDRVYAQARQAREKDQS
jgi:predicted dehydrogenase